MTRLAVAVLGSLLLLAGAALLVLPGPGLLVIAAGLAVLASRFAWAARLLERVRTRAYAELDQMAHNRTRALAGTASACAITVIGVLDLVGVDIPFVGPFSAAVLIVSGLLLLGTVLYARRAISRSSPMAKAEPGSVGSRERVGVSC